MLTCGGQKQDDWKHDDVPSVVPDYVETVRYEAIGNDGHGDVNGVLRDERRVIEGRVECQRAIRFAAFHHEGLYCSPYI